jgi:hypothetical protein
MNQTGSISGEITQKLAFIFTNASGNVIFADQGYLQLIGDSSNRSVSGEKLNNLLGVDSESAEKLVVMTRKLQRFDQLGIPIHAMDGTILNSIGTSITTKNESGNVIGIDLVLKIPPLQAGVEPDNIQTHVDVVKAFVENTMIVGSRNYSRTFLQSYLVAQVDVIQILLSRINGVAARNAFEIVVNHVAKANALPISMKNGHLEFQRKDINIQDYRNFINHIIGYAVDVLGRQVVKKEVLMVDKFIGSGTLGLISQMDLRIFLTD